MHPVGKVNGAKLLRCIFVLALFAYANTVVQSAVEAASKPYDPELVLGDLFFVPTGIFKVPAYVANYGLALFTIAFFVRVWVATKRPLNKHVEKYLCLAAAVHALRAVSIILTRLPKCTPDCIPTATQYHPLVEGVLIIVGVHRTCADLFFSGHAAHATLLLSISVFGTKTGRTVSVPEAVFDAILFFVYIVYLVLIPISRFHYTADVFGGVVVALALLLASRLPR